MESRAPYGLLGPCSLTAPFAAWLRTQGWTATEYGQGISLAGFAAHWVGSRGERFELDYAWCQKPSPEATCRLRVLYPGATLFQQLFTAQYVRRVREARTVLCNCVAYANARLLAKGFLSDL
jgi:hypothetical protein